MKAAALVFLLAIGFTAYTQKLPNVQQVSLRAPANVKIDGKATEWHNKFQAYNNATDVFYTLSNDNENLYLVLKVKEYRVAEHIVKHGVRFTINHSTSKKDVSPLVISYPTIAYKEYGPIINLIGSKYFEMREKPADNSAEALNSLLKARSKFILVDGISNIADKEISIYNDKGISAASTFENPFAYVYELAIPLKYLSFNANSIAAFSYQIKINFPDPNEKPPPPPPPGVLVITHPQGANVAVTDFWGEYTLAK